MLPEIMDTWVQARPEWFSTWRGTIMVYDDLDRHEGVLVHYLDTDYISNDTKSCVIYNESGWVNSLDAKIMHTNIESIYLDATRPECLDHLVRWARGKKRLSRFSQRYGLHLYIDECGVTGRIRGLQLGWDSLPWPDHFPKYVKDEDNLKLSDGTEILAVKAFVHLINKGYFDAP